MSVTKAVSSLDSVVVKSPNDRRVYRVIELENGLSALLIHDPDIYLDGSAADGQNTDGDQMDEDGEEDSDGSYEDEEMEGDEDEDEDEVKGKEDHQTKKVKIDHLPSYSSSDIYFKLVWFFEFRQLQLCVLQWAASWILPRRKAWLTFLVFSSFYEF